MEKREKTAEHPRLGALVLERRHSQKEAVGILITGGVVALLSAVGTIFGGQSGPVAGIFGGITTVAVLVFGIVKLIAARTAYLVYERGLVEESGGRSIEVPYTELVEITFDAVRVKHKVVSKTHYKLKLLAEDGFLITMADDDKFRVIGSTGQATRVKQIAMIVAQGVANILLERVRAGEEVQWVRGARLTPAGLANGRGVVVPWRAVGSLRMENGYFWVCRAGSEAAVVQGESSDANFLPGWAFLEQMAERVRAEAAQALQST
ncbi:MAG TPA: hypothetical protein VEA69_10795 [Tepidisphaeraceae bacterium]|nr:hypothetical protein [Tepidisphaeraceae bacterium]